MCRLATLVLGPLLLLVIACASEPPPVPPTPNIEATVTAMVEALPTQALPPTYTPAPPATPYPTYTLVPSATPNPNLHSAPSATPRPTLEPLPTYTPYPTLQPATNLIHRNLRLPLRPQPLLPRRQLQYPRLPSTNLDTNARTQTVETHRLLKPGLGLRSGYK